jgi:hypothetical protein
MARFSRYWSRLGWRLAAPGGGPQRAGRTGRHAALRTTTTAGRRDTWAQASALLRRKRPRDGLRLRWRHRTGAHP